MFDKGACSLVKHGELLDCMWKFVVHPFLFDAIRDFLI